MIMRSIYEELEPEPEPKGGRRNQKKKKRCDDIWYNSLDEQVGNNKFSSHFHGF